MVKQYISFILCIVSFLTFTFHN